MNEGFCMIRLGKLKHEECNSVLQGETVIFGALTSGPRYVALAWLSIAVTVENCMLLKLSCANHHQLVFQASYCLACSSIVTSAQ